MSGTIQWSIVLPAYNEAARILPYLRSITSFMQDRGQPYEVLVVDDGSTDSTAAVVESLASSTPEIQLLRAPVRQGKGAAVRRGMQAAVGRLQLFADADGATPIQELTQLEQAVANGADVAIGSRALASQLPGYAVQTRWYRTVLTTLVKSILSPSCGRAASEELPTRNAALNCSVKPWQQTSSGSLRLMAMASISNCSTSHNNADTISQKSR
jgi:glycosyltransferase involved in cell wall biosynthesis